MFLDGTEELGSETLSAGGIASFSTATLNAGTHSITVVYRGDDNFNPHNSAVLNQVVVVEGQDFGMSATPGSATVTSGSSVEFTITSTAMRIWRPSVIEFTVSPSPAFAPTCALNSSVNYPAANGSATSKLMVDNDRVYCISPSCVSLWLEPAVCAVVPSSMAALGVGFGSERSRRKKIPGGLLIILVLVGLGFQAACGGGSPASPGVRLRANTPSQLMPSQAPIAHTTAMTVMVQ